MVLTENIYNKPVLSLSLINHIINDNEVNNIYENVSKISFTQLLSIFIIRELEKLDMIPELIDSSVIINHDFTSIIEETITSKTSRVIVFFGGEIKSFSRSYAYRLYRPLSITKNSIPITEILLNLVCDLANLFTSKKANRLEYLSDNELRKYYPLEEYTEEEFESIKENIRLLTSVFFDALRNEKL